MAGERTCVTIMYFRCACNLASTCLLIPDFVALKGQ